MKFDLNRDKRFLEDDLWYPCEQYAIIAFVMIPGWVLFGHWLWTIMDFHGWDFWIPIESYGLVLFIILWEAICT